MSKICLCFSPGGMVKVSQSFWEHHHLQEEVCWSLTLLAKVFLKCDQRLNIGCVSTFGNTTYFQARELVEAGIAKDGSNLCGMAALIDWIEPESTEERQPTPPGQALYNWESLAKQCDRSLLSQY